MERIDTRNPVDWRHPLNRGLRGAWLSIPAAGWAGGNTLRDLVRRNPATTTNGPSWVGGRGGFGALSFNGVNQSAQTAANPFGANPITNWTLAAGVTPLSLSGEQVYFGHGGETGVSGGYCLELESGKFKILFNGAFRIDPNFTPTLGTRYLFAASLTAPNLFRAYVNGSLVLSSASTPLAPDATHPVHFGFQPGPGRYANTVIDSGMVWHRALEGADHAALYRQWRRGYPGTLNRLPRAWSFGVVAAVVPPGPPARVTTAGADYSRTTTAGADYSRTTTAGSDYSRTTTPGSVQV